MGRARPCPKKKSENDLGKVEVKKYTQRCGKVKNIAKVAQLVEHDLAKVGVAGSSPVFRSRHIKNAPFHRCGGAFFL